jgi:hypothetical protein
MPSWHKRSSTRRSISASTWATWRWRGAALRSRKKEGRPRFEPRRLERFRVEKLERIGPFGPDLERITLDGFERVTVEGEDADVSSGDTEKPDSRGSSTKDGE